MIQDVRQHHYVIEGDYLSETGLTETGRAFVSEHDLFNLTNLDEQDLLSLHDYFVSADSSSHSLHILSKDVLSDLEGVSGIRHEILAAPMAPIKNGDSLSGFARDLSSEPLGKAAWAQAVSDLYQLNESNPAVVTKDLIQSGGWVVLPRPDGMIEETVAQQFESCEDTLSDGTSVAFDAVDSENSFAAVEVDDFVADQIAKSIDPVVEKPMVASMAGALGLALAVQPLNSVVASVSSGFDRAKKQLFDVLAARGVSVENRLVIPTSGTSYWEKQVRWSYGGLSVALKSSERGVGLDSRLGVRGVAYGVSGDFFKQGAIELGTYSRGDGASSSRVKIKSGIRLSLDGLSRVASEEIKFREDTTRGSGSGRATKVSLPEGTVSQMRASRSAGTQAVSQVIRQANPMVSEELSQRLGQSFAKGPYLFLAEVGTSLALGLTLPEFYGRDQVQTIGAISVGSLLERGSQALSASGSLGILAEATGVVAAKKAIESGVDVLDETTLGAIIPASIHKTGFTLPGLVREMSEWTLAHVTKEVIKNRLSVAASQYVSEGVFAASSSFSTVLLSGAVLIAAPALPFLSEGQKSQVEQHERILSVVASLKEKDFAWDDYEEAFLSSNDSRLFLGEHDYTLKDLLTAKDDVFCLSQMSFQDPEKSLDQYQRLLNRRYMNRFSNLTGWEKWSHLDLAVLVAKAWLTLNPAMKNSFVQRFAFDPFSVEIPGDHVFQEKSPNDEVQLVASL